MPATHIIDQGDLRKYRIEIPNLVDEMGLSVHELRLYVHFKHVAGSNGSCWKGTRALARDCQMSPAKVSEAKRSLAKRGLIVIVINNRARGESDVVKIVDI